MKNAQDDFHFIIFSVSIQYSDQNHRHGKARDDTHRSWEAAETAMFQTHMLAQEGTAIPA